MGTTRRIVSPWHTRGALQPTPLPLFCCQRRRLVHTVATDDNKTSKPRAKPKQLTDSMIFTESDGRVHYHVFDFFLPIRPNQTLLLVTAIPVVSPTLRGGILYVPTTTKTTTTSRNKIPTKSRRPHPTVEFLDHSAQIKKFVKTHSAVGCGRVSSWALRSVSRPV